MPDAAFSLYLLRCADGSLYTGIARDVNQRLAEHRSGVRGARYLRGRSPFELVFEHPVGPRGPASRLEYRVKQLSRRQKEDLISGRLRLRDIFDGLHSGRHASGESGG